MLGTIQVYFTKNNIFFVLSCSGTSQVKAVYSSTGLGFKKIRREALQIIQEAAKQIKRYPFKVFILKIRGFSRFRNLLVKEFLKNRLNVIKVIDVTNVAFNGCRAPARRRI
jgi:ribosomal protein S11